MDHDRPDGPLKDRRTLCDVQFDLSSLVDLRKTVMACGAAQGLQDMPLTRFVLAVHEVAVNAVCHAGGRGGLRLWRTGDTLHCLVSDDGPGIPKQYRGLRPQPPGKDVYSSSRGLWLVGQLCPDVRIKDRADRGTDVLLRFPLPTHHESAGRRTEDGHGSA